MPSRTQRTTKITAAIALFIIGAIGFFAGSTQLIAQLDSLGIHEHGHILAHLAGIGAWAIAVVISIQPVAARLRRRRFRWVLEAEGY